MLQLLRSGMLIALLVVTAGGTSPRAYAAQEPLAGPAPVMSQPSEADLGEAVRALGHPLPARRREAVRRLAAWGPLAFERLRTVATGSDLEAALLAQDLLHELGEVVLIGGRIRLEVDRQRIAWHEPISLTVQVENTTAGQVRVPWPQGAASEPLIQDDARQVGAMMDIADFLIVTGPGGQEVELRVDPIERDSAVHQAVNRRAGDDPPSHVVPGGASDRLTVSRFNRGWARYPFLQKGTYTIELRYQPQWQDEAWTRQGFGRVASNRAQVEVLESAPESIRQANRPLKLVLTQHGQSLEGELVSTWDRDLYLNVNIGGPRETHARIEWQPVSLGQDQPEPFELETDATGAAFQSDRLRRLGPGERLTIAHAQVSAVLQRAHPEVKGRLQSTPLALRYSHLATPESLRAALRAAGKHEGVPAELFAGSVTSETVLVEVPAAE